MFEGSQWDDVLYDRTMSDEKLVHVVLSGSEDEECQEECQEEPLKKKIRVHPRVSILGASRQQQNNRINNLYKQLTEVAAAEKITATQLAAMLLRRAAYMTSKDISEVADNIVQEKPLGVVKEA